MEINFIEALEKRRDKDGIKGAVNALFVAEVQLSEIFDSSASFREMFKGKKFDDPIILYDLLAKQLSHYILGANISKRKLEIPLPRLCETLSTLVNMLVNERRYDLKGVYSGLVEFGRSRFMDNGQTPTSFYGECVNYLKGKLV